MRSCNEKSKGISCFAFALLRGVLVSLAVTLVALLLLALVLTIWDVPIGVTAYLAVLCLGLGALTGGWISAKKIGEKGLLWGAVCGFVLFLLLLFTGLLFSEQGAGLSPWFRLAVSVLCGAIGGVLGINSRR